VIRNANPPIFTRDSYQDVIQDTLAVGSSILQVTANDRDNDAIRYTVIDGTEASEFFFLNPSTGVISLSKYMYNIGEDQYRFTVQASDQRVNVKTDLADVFIQIQRDQQAPQFIQEPYSGVVREVDINGTTIRQTTCIDGDIRGRIVYQTVPYTVGSAFFSVNADNGNVFLYDTAALRQHAGTVYTVSLSL
jgi:hypothetical protein